MTVYKFKGCRLEGIILLNMMTFVITVHSKMLPAKHYHADVYIHCAETALVKNMLKEVNKTHLIYDLVCIL